MPPGGGAANDAIAEEKLLTILFVLIRHARVAKQGVTSGDYLHLTPAMKGEEPEGCIGDSRVALER